MNPVSDLALVPDPAPDPVLDAVLNPKSDPVPDPVPDAVPDLVPDPAPDPVLDPAQIPCRIWIRRRIQYRILRQIQKIQTIKTKKTDGISLWMYIIFVISIFLWLIYGILIKSYEIILANTITLPLAIYVLVYVIKNDINNKS